MLSLCQSHVECELNTNYELYRIKVHEPKI